MATKTKIGGKQPQVGLRKSASGRKVGSPAVLHSRVTERWQTTLPSGVRKALGLDAGAEIFYEIRGDTAVIRKAEPEEEDPVVVAFLNLLERDMVAHPERLAPVTESLAARLRGLTHDVKVGRDERIEGPVAL